MRQYTEKVKKGPVDRYDFDSLDEFIRVGGLADLRINGSDRWRGASADTLRAWVAQRSCPPQVAIIDKYRNLFAPVLRDVNLGLGVAPTVIGVPCVPAVLAGHPLNMIGLTDVESAAPPRRIWVEVVASASVDAESFSARAGAAIALCDLLSHLGPVEVRCVASTGTHQRGVVPTWPLMSNPLDLNYAALSTHPAFVRGLEYEWAEARGANGQWGLDLVGGSPKILGKSFEDGDVYLPAATTEDTKAIEADPVQWLRGKAAEAGVEI